MKSFSAGEPGFVAEAYFRIYLKELIFLEQFSEWSPSNPNHQTIAALGVSEKRRFFLFFERIIIDVMLTHATSAEKQLVYQVNTYREIIRLVK